MKKTLLFLLRVVRLTIEFSTFVHWIPFHKAWASDVVDSDAFCCSWNCTIGHLTWSSVRFPHPNLERLPNDGISVELRKNKYINSDENTKDS